MAIVKDFEELGIYRKARLLAKQVYDITRVGEFRYDTRFVQQIRAAAGSICDNIAEGFERQGNKEFVNFLYISKGSFLFAGISCSPRKIVADMLSAQAFRTVLKQQLP